MVPIITPSIGFTTGSWVTICVYLCMSFHELGSTGVFIKALGSVYNGLTTDFFGIKSYAWGMDRALAKGCQGKDQNFGGFGDALWGSLGGQMIDGIL